MEEFIRRKASSNENFSFGAKLLERIKILFDLLRADREGNWNLHLDAFQRSLDEFAAWNCTNYLRWGSVDLGEMRLLPTTSPTIFEHFSKGKSFSIKTNKGRFVAVGGDQKLEQTINLSSKRSAAVVGNARNSHFFAQWALIYHDILSVKNLYCEYTGDADYTFEGWLRNESSPSFTKKKETQIQKLIDYIEEKGSPFSVTCPETLHNIVTKELYPIIVKEDVLNSSTKDKEKYLQFRKERLEEKATKISSTIHRLNLKTIKSNPNDQSQCTQSRKSTQMATSLNERKIEIARERGAGTNFLLDVGIVDSPLLFTENGLMTKPSKSKLLPKSRSH